VCAGSARGLRSNFSTDHDDQAGISPLLLRIAWMGVEKMGRPEAKRVRRIDSGDTPVAPGQGITILRRMKARPPAVTGTV
jgi:hypothetical protein